MRQHLLLAGGVVHCLAVVFHVVLPRLAGWAQVLQTVPQVQRGDLYVFNAAVGYALAVFAVLSLGYPRELLSTPVGRAVTLLIAGFWAFRAASEFIWPPAVSSPILALCLAMAALYAYIALGTRLPL